MTKDKVKDGQNSDNSENYTCGIIMPISPIDGCSAEHWTEVKQIIQDAVNSISEPKYTPKLVSDADDIGVIQKRIVQGVYNSDIVICDVSAKNSNVMFELGMRLAFDKPTVLIKDDKTEYSFDTSIIEHISYPRDLRFTKIVGFKKSLAEKLVATHSASKNTPGHSTFLKNFGTFKVAHLNQQEAPGEQVILEMLTEMQKELSVLRRQNIRMPRFPGQYESNMSTVMNALLEIKKLDPKCVFEPNDALVDKVISFRPDLTKYYPTKESFQESLKLACEFLKPVL